MSTERRGVRLPAAHRGARPAAWPLAAALVALGACTDRPAPPAGAGCDVDGGPETVVVAGPPARWEGAGEGADFRLLARAGGTREGEALAMPAGLAAGPGGRVAVVDFQLAELVVTGPEGGWRVRAGRGPGPGELSVPVAVAWGAGDSLVVFDIGASELEVLAPDSGGRTTALPAAFTGPVVASGQLGWVAVDGQGTAYLEVEESVAGEPGTGRRALLRLAPGADAPDTLTQGTVATMPEGRFRGWARPGFPRPVAAVGAAGRAWAADPAGAYRLTRFDSAGRPDLRVCRDAAPEPLTPAERGEGEVPEGREELARSFAQGPRPDRPAAIARLVVGGEGRVWVQRERPSPWDDLGRIHGAPGALHDVFEADGRFLGTIRLPEGFRLGAARADTVYGLRRGELDELWIESYVIAEP